MEIITNPDVMHRWSKERSRSGKTIGLVPTMGFFHEGHISLMRKAAELCDLVVVSLFVNPTQFGPNEDLDRYPRDFERDMALVAKERVAAVFAPTPALMYPDGFQTEVRVKELAHHLCGLSRPGHFAGVTTVVSKLFHIVQPDAAVFGEKDFQQLAIIRRMVKDLNIGIKIIGHPIVREADGLAMSSRNTNLNPAHRTAALSLSTALKLAREHARNGVIETAVLYRELEAHIHAHPAARIDYVSFVDCETLEAAATVNERTVLALAVKIDGKVRLIDNGFVLEPNPA